MNKKISVFILSSIFLLTSIFTVNTFADGDEVAKNDALNLTSVSAVLMEPVTGTIIYEKNSHEKLRPASVTKIMTLLLIYEAIQSGKISWNEEVVVSQHASSMGGSQVYLEANEVQTVETLTKCISVASANDGAVAMAEHIAGSEDAFVQMMNNKAADLGMVDTNFENASGLDSDNHFTSAYDIAIMSRELTVNYPQIFDFSTIWTDTITHNTARGSEEFGLTNTNKLIQWYDDATGLKTGSTSLAKYCLSGTASRNGLDLIAVVMAAPDYKTRFEEVMHMFDYGFAVCQKYEDDVVGKVIGNVEVNKGIEDQVEVIANDNFTTIITNNEFNIDNIEKVINIPDCLDAPIKKDQKVGDIIYKYDGEEIGKIDLLASEEVSKANLKYYILEVFKNFFG